jgi:hypothetical protein
VNLRTPKPDASAQAVDSWKLHIKSDAKEFAPFKDKAFWICGKERFITIVATQGLNQLIDKTHIVTNLALDKSQLKWLHKTFQDVMQHPICKLIVIKLLADKDTRLIWEEICEAMGNSMFVKLMSQTISAFLASMRPTPTLAGKVHSNLS